ncbi:hypothetical protein ACFP1Z_28155 [Streptomyces gamaensis]|uniref:Secreted protein n=1 Tax=Streptomyces gamaensis TaxID=1763542 RepID=A0ABW0Z6L6_9ACTN
MPRLALYAFTVCALAAAAAVISFVRGSWLVGGVWILLIGVSSNIAWYYIRKTKNDKAARLAGEAAQ